MIRPAALVCLAGPMSGCTLFGLSECAGRGSAPFGSFFTMAESKEGFFQKPQPHAFN